MINAYIEVKYWSILDLNIFKDDLTDIGLSSIGGRVMITIVNHLEKNNKAIRTCVLGNVKRPDTFISTGNLNLNIEIKQSDTYPS